MSSPGIQQYSSPPNSSGVPPMSHMPGGPVGTHGPTGPHGQVSISSMALPMGHPMPGTMVSHTISPTTANVTNVPLINGRHCGQQVREDKTQ